MGKIVGIGSLFNVLIARKRFATKSILYKTVILAACGAAAAASGKSSHVKSYRSIGKPM
jgi:hypothetical protein